MHSTISPGLNPIQVSLLRMFDRDMSESEVLTLKQALVKHYSALLQDEVEKVIAKKSIRRPI